ncbi:superoxide dismutase [Tubulinosema ratisbonensis]|uniref:Superoxide dismutase n=1 Tax=Tubulinosema ratisbonensis TaxID=291195 RepID=A0A437AN68_9MICR|nr:superoxide dismutase [Tubulinosema ratisbonensis]
MSFTIPKLQYDTKKFDQNFYSEEAFFLHLNKHHQTYVTKLNEAVQSVKLNLPLTKLLTESIKNTSLPEKTRTLIRNNGGGHYNHSLFWLCMSPEKKCEISEELKSKLENKFGSFDKFINQFKEQSVTLFGSGWTSLVIKNDEFEIVQTANQNSPISEGGSVILTLDVWEHAYYVVYKNDRKRFIDDWVEHINWKNVSSFYDCYAKKNVPVEVECDGSVKI